MALDALVVGGCTFPNSPFPQHSDCGSISLSAMKTPQGGAGSDLRGAGGTYCVPMRLRICSTGRRMARPLP
jgi:hypothetical protein